MVNILGGGASPFSVNVELVYRKKRLNKDYLARRLSEDLDEGYEEVIRTIGSEVPKGERSPTPMFEIREWRKGDAFYKVKLQVGSKSVNVFFSGRFRSAKGFKELILNFLNWRSFMEEKYKLRKELESPVEVVVSSRGKAISVLPSAVVGAILQVDEWMMMAVIRGRLSEERRLQVLEELVRRGWNFMGWIVRLYER